MNLSKSTVAETDQQENGDIDSEHRQIPICVVGRRQETGTQQASSLSIPLRSHHCRNKRKQLAIVGELHAVVELFPEGERVILLLICAKFTVDAGKFNAFHRQHQMARPFASASDRRTAAHASHLRREMRESTHRSVNPVRHAPCVPLMNSKEVQERTYRTC